MFEDYSKRLVEKKETYKYNGSKGLALINQERVRQVTELGTDEMLNDHPDWYENNQLLFAAEAYLMRPFMSEKDVKKLWPWKPETFKPTPENRIKELVKAGTLIAAEIDRLVHLEK